MLEVKIVCDCGTKYKFDVEPLNGRMPGPVQCPVCSADGTEAGNRLIASALAQSQAPLTVPAANSEAPRISIPAKPPSNAAAPAITIPKPAASAPPVTPASQASLSTTPQKVGIPGPAAAPSIPVPAAAGAVRLGITGHAAPAPTPAEPLSAATSVAHAPPVPQTPPAPPIPMTANAVASASRPKAGSGSAGPRLMLGYIGAAVGGLLGMAIWYGIIVVTNYELGLIAWGVGGLTGFCALVAAGAQHKSVGVAAAICAVVAIIGGEFLATKHVAEKMITDQIGQDFALRVAEAKEVTAAKTDDELKAFIAKSESDEGTKVEASQIDAARLEKFKKTELPRYKDLAEGKVTKNQYQEKRMAIVRALIPFSLVLKESISLFSLLWIFFGVGTAYRMAAGK